MREIKVVGAEEAINWYKSGWKVFSSDMLNWVLLALVFGVIAVVAMMIPLIGPIIFYLAFPLLQAGMLYAVQKTHEGKKIEIMDLFTLFQDANKRTPLLILGALMLGAAFVSMMLLGATMSSSLSASGLVPSLSFGSVLIGLVVTVLMAMLFLYATPLVLFENVQPIEAVKQSWSASVKNIMPVALFVLIYVSLSVIAAIPFGLGFLVLLPVLLAAVYASYKALFGGIRINKTS